MREKSNTHAIQKFLFFLPPFPYCNSSLCFLWRKLSKSLTVKSFFFFLIWFPCPTRIRWESYMKVMIIHCADTTCGTCILQNRTARNLYFAVKLVQTFLQHFYSFSCSPSTACMVVVQAGLNIHFFLSLFPDLFVSVTSFHFFSILDSHHHHHSHHPCLVFHLGFLNKGKWRSREKERERERERERELRRKSLAWSSAASSSSCSSTFSVGNWKDASLLCYSYTLSPLFPTFSYSSS